MMVLMLVLVLFETVCRLSSDRTGQEIGKMRLLSLLIDIIQLLASSFGIVTSEFGPCVLEPDLYGGVISQHWLLV